MRLPRDPSALVTLGPARPEWYQASHGRPEACAVVRRVKVPEAQLGDRGLIL